MSMAKPKKSPNAPNISYKVEAITGIADFQAKKDSHEKEESLSEKDSRIKEESLGEKNSRGKEESSSCEDSHNSNFNMDLTFSLSWFPKLAQNQERSKIVQESGLEVHLGTRRLERLYSNDKGQLLVQKEVDLGLLGLEGPTTCSTHVAEKDKDGRAPPAQESFPYEESHS